MKLGILSDIHGNLEAFTAVLKECHSLGVQSILCIGDVVGYGPNPKECLQLIQSINAVCVAGNHDWAVSGKLDPSYFTDDGKQVVMWSRTQLDQEDMRYINSLQLIYQNQGVTMVHSSLNHPELFFRVGDASAALSTFELLKTPVCFVGHTHLPKIFVKHEDRLFEAPQMESQIYNDRKYIINVGSVGQPRDYNPYASYGFYDLDSELIEIRRVRYDIKTTQNKILERGLPKSLAQRLELGR